jgi:hypothetical protein
VETLWGRAGGARAPCSCCAVCRCAIPPPTPHPHPNPQWRPHPTPRPQGDFDLSNAEDGLLATAFLVGLLIASPVFSEACKHYSAFRLIGIGMGTWTLAVTGCGLSFNFASMFVCRMFVGVGEASFVALASPFIGAEGRGQGGGGGRRERSGRQGAFLSCFGGPPVGQAANLSSGRPYGPAARPRALPSGPSGPSSHANHPRRQTTTRRPPARHAGSPSSTCASPSALRWATCTAASSPRRSAGAPPFGSWPASWRRL